MLAPGGSDYSGNGADYRSEPGWSEASPRLDALASALGQLAAASDSVAEALTRHDRTALEASNEKADAMVQQVQVLGESLTPEDRTMLDAVGIPALRERIALGARRNAYLIEQAWAVDAALVKLLLGQGRIGADGAVAAYSADPGPACVDRGA